MRLGFSYALTFVLLGTSPVFAQQTGTSDAETIVVTATRVPTPAQDVASSITIVTADEIARRQRDTLPDVLLDVPGLNVVQSGGPGAQTSVFLRGTDSNHVKVLIDGIDVSDPSSPVDAFDFGQLLTEDIERVEILRGPQSGLYGSDAIGGVINVITKQGQGPAQFTAVVQGGSFDTFNQAGSVAGSADGFHYAANIQHFYSGATPVTPEDILPPAQPRLDDRYDNVTASTKLGYDVTDNFDLGLVARSIYSRLHFTGDNFNLFPSVPDSQQSIQQDVQYYTRGTAHLVLFGGLFEQTLGLAYASSHTSDFSPDSGTTLDAGDRVKVDWQGNLRVTDGELLVLGAEHSRDELRFPISAQTSINSGYAELQSSLAPDFFSAINIRYDDNNRFGSDVTYRVAPTYLIAGTGTKLKASIGTGFKAPTLSEMFENFPSFGFFGNPNLEPEKDFGWEAGFEQSAFDDRVQFGATYFHNSIRDLIEGTFTTYVNVDRAETDGVESFVSYRPFEALTLRVDYTFTDANDETLQQELLRRPKHKASWNAAWQATKELELDATLLYVGPWLDVTRDALAVNTRAPGYMTVNIAANYALNDELTLFGRVDNLFGEHYQNPIGFLRPGRGVFGGIRAKI
ncbi:MAG TPA: TonB-dependent receptor [Rhizomicrobium sp.]|nr:TonB-dependent receptor [Rhizomicrobium sp.]